MSANRGVPFSRCYIFGQGTFLQEKPALRVENKEVDNSVQPVVSMDLFPACGPNNFPLFIDNVENFV
jgi:hypothetical protein